MRIKDVYTLSEAEEITRKYISENLELREWPVGYDEEAERFIGIPVRIDYEFLFNQKNMIFRITVKVLRADTGEAIVAIGTALRVKHVASVYVVNGRTLFVELKRIIDDITLAEDDAVSTIVDETMFLYLNTK